MGRWWHGATAVLPPKCSVSNKELEAVINCCTTRSELRTVLGPEIAASSNWAFPENSITVGRHFLECTAMSRHLLFLLLPLLLARFATARERPRAWIEVRRPRFAIVTDSSES